MNETLRNRLIFAFYIPSALIAIGWAVLAPILPVYASNLTESYILIGVMLAAASIGRMAGSVPSSWLMARFGIKYTMLIGIGFALLPVLALFVVRDLFLIITLLFFVGIGLAIYQIARHTYVAVVIPLTIRGRAISLLGGVFRVGLFIGPIIGGWVGGAFGLPSAFIAFFIIGLTSIFFVLRYMQNVENSDIAENIPQTEQPQTDISFMQMLRENYTVLVSAGLGQWLAQLTRQGWRVLIPLYAANILNLDIQTIGLVMGFGAAFDMLFFWVSGLVMDRFGRKWAIVPSFVMQGLGTGLILLAGNALTLTLFAAFIGFANGLSSGTMMTTGADLAPDEARAKFLSTWSFIGDVGGFSGPMIVGVVAQAFIIQISVLSIAGAGFGAALLFALFVPETLKSKRKNQLEVHKA